MGNANLKDNANLNKDDKNILNKTISESIPNKDVNEIMDYIATNYILSMDFESLQKLYDKKYCDNLIILTSDIVEKYFTNTDITYLSDRITKKDNLFFINRDNWKNIDKIEPSKKKELCNGIAKFYITIAHVFASIITTINPIYIFTDLNGEIKKISLNERNKIPYGVKTQILKYNICDNRISSLRNNSHFDKSTGDLTINPSACNVNLKDDGELKTLEDEPGIPELLDLYNDDNYDFETGTFNGMSEQTKIIFQENLKVFYTTFTGNQEMPSEITKFSDIKLRDYNKNGKCQTELNNAVSGNISNELFMKYADNLKEMITKTNKNRDELIEILNDLFVYFIDDETQSKKIRINPKLNEDNLKDVIIKTRSSVIKLYLNCEEDYVEGIKFYEAIVEQKILETSQKQIESLKKMSENLISSEQEFILPEDKFINKNLEEAETKIREIEKPQEIQQIQEPQEQEIISEPQEQEIISEPQEIQTLQIQKLQEQEIIPEPQEQEIISEPQEIQKLQIQKLQEQEIISEPQEIQTLKIQEPQEQKIILEPQEIQTLQIQEQQEQEIIQEPQKIQTLQIQEPQEQKIILEPQEQKIILEPQEQKIIPEQSIQEKYKQK